MIEQVLLTSWLLPGSHSRSNLELRNIPSKVKKMKFNFHLCNPSWHQEHDRNHLSRCLQVCLSTVQEQ